MANNHTFNRPNTGKQADAGVTERTQHQQGEDQEVYFADLGNPLLVNPLKENHRDPFLGLKGNA